MRLSIVATLYMSAPYVQEFCQRSVNVARSLVQDDFEIILVNDGSPDTALEVATSLIPDIPQLKVIDLSRNFGHHKAMLTGLSHAQGDLVYLLDSDLEEEPEWLLSFEKHMQQEGCDVVFGAQKVRKGGGFERWTGELYYRVFNFLCDLDHPRNITTARLMTQRYVQALLRFSEREVVFSCLCAMAGFKQCEYVVNKHDTSPTTYSTRKRFKLLFNSIISFSAAPLELIFYSGVIIFSFSIIAALYLVILRLFFVHRLDGWTSLMVSVWLLGGLLISFIGVLGMYISKVFTEVKQRPLTVIRKIYANNSISKIKEK